jgi:hypothetical protein
VKPWGAAGQAGTVALEQHRRERRDVLRPCPQGREREVQDVQPVEEILAEPTGGDRGPQVDVGRRDHPDVDRALGGGADPPHPPLLQGAVELHLHRQRQLGDLVEEDRAAVGLLEQARGDRRSAPVKLPRTWPNSSLSSSASGIAPQLTATKRAPPARPTRGSRGPRPPCRCRSRR